MIMARRELAVFLLSLVTLAVCALPEHSRIPRKKGIDPQNARRETISAKKFQDAIPSTLHVSKLETSPAKASSTDKGRFLGGNKRSARRCLSGHVYLCFPKKTSGRRREFA
ncbi:hypothetical protein AWC38_SpisGene25836 [Stylophora pistillata]|uniref:Secreted protein n=1 Tax=Stylophora pistillata TaxID=50429 RepID=A0A2B4RX68_STYPI|nr:hypothetical protein AWC38_SpisGene25836 [Stylophora pistillata]